MILSDPVVIDGESYASVTHYELQQKYDVEGNSSRNKFSLLNEYGQLSAIVY